MSAVQQSIGKAVGFTLIELLLAIALAAVLLTALVQLTLSVQRSVMVQQALSGLQTQARYAEQQLASRAGSAGYDPTPWSGTGPAAVVGSLPAGTAGRPNARLAFRALSQTNCLGNRNPVLDSDGDPRFFLRVSRWDITPDRRLVETCHYGPVGTPGVRQLNASTRVEGVEALRVRFAEDLDGDGRADRWVRAGAWSDPTQLLGLRFALLLVSPVVVAAEPAGTVDLLGEPWTPEDDGRPRWLLERTVAFGSTRS